MAETTQTDDLRQKLAVALELLRALKPIAERQIINAATVSVAEIGLLHTVEAFLLCNPPTS